MELMAQKRRQSWLMVAQQIGSCHVINWLQCPEILKFAEIKLSNRCGLQLVDTCTRPTPACQSCQLQRDTPAKAWAPMEVSGNNGSPVSKFCLYRFSLSCLHRCICAIMCRVYVFALLQSRCLCQWREILIWIKTNQTVNHYRLL